MPMPDSEPIIPPGVRTLSVLPRTPAPPPTEATFARKPSWLKVRASYGPNYRELKGLMRGAELHTVCEEAGCPNIFECWEAREATFLIGGEHCTRACPFCQIASGKPEGYDTDEPRRVAHAVARMGLNFAVITGVARDDLDDGGAWLFAESVRQVRELLPTCGVEVLIPDFHGKAEALRQVTDALPDVLGHNLETVPRLYKRIRPGFTYAGSLELLARARAWLPAGHATKSNLILGMGEERAEVEETMRHLREVGVELPRRPDAPRRLPQAARHPPPLGPGRRRHRPPDPHRRRGVIPGAAWPSDRDHLNVGALADERPQVGRVGGQHHARPAAKRLRRDQRVHGRVHPRLSEQATRGDRDPRPHDRNVSRCQQPVDGCIARAAPNAFGEHHRGDHDGHAGLHCLGEVPNDGSTLALPGNDRPAVENQPRCCRCHCLHPSSAALNAASASASSSLGMGPCSASYSSSSCRRCSLRSLSRSAWLM